MLIAVILFKIIRRKSDQLAVSSTPQPPTTSEAHRHFTAMECEVAELHHRRYSRTDSPQRPEATTALHRNNGSAVWVDDELLSWRVDYDGIKLTQRLSSSGPFVEVWIATYRLDTIAAKVLKPCREDSHASEMIDPVILSKFLMEAKMLSRLDHPRIVAFYGVAWRSESEVLAAMEFMPQLDVHTYLQTLRSREWTLRKLQIALDVVEALVYIHSLQPALIHCGLKSTNVLLNELLHAKLSDFGVAKFLHSKAPNRAYDRDEDANMDRIRHVVSQGTRALPWVAPEVILGNAEYSEAVDVYAFGVLLSELDTHELPYSSTRGKNRLQIGDHEIQKRVAAGKLRPPLSSSCPSDIRLLAASCLATDPSERPSSVQLAYAANKLVAKAMATAPVAEEREPVIIVGPGQRPLAGTSYSLGGREADEVDWAIKTVGQQYAAM
jgi:serine/threonine protein kinase